MTVGQLTDAVKEKKRSKKSNRRVSTDSAYWNAVVLHLVSKKTSRSRAHHHQRDSPTGQKSQEAKQQQQSTDTTPPTTTLVVGLFASLRRRLCWDLVAGVACATAITSKENKRTLWTSKTARTTTINRYDDENKNNKQPLQQPWWWDFLQAYTRGYDEILSLVLPVQPP